MDQNVGRHMGQNMENSMGHNVQGQHVARSMEQNMGMDEKMD